MLLSILLIPLSNQNLIWHLIYDSSLNWLLVVGSPPSSPSNKEGSGKLKIVNWLQKEGAEHIILITGELRDFFMFRWEAGGVQRTIFGGSFTLSAFLASELNYDLCKSVVWHKKSFVTI